MEVFELEHDFSFSAVNVCEGDERPCSELQVGFVCFQTVSFLVIEAFDLGKCTFFVWLRGVSTLILVLTPSVMFLCPLGLHFYSSPDHFYFIYSAHYVESLSFYRNLSFRFS